MPAFERYAATVSVVPVPSPSPAAPEAVIDGALVHLIDLLGAVAVERTGVGGATAERGAEWARAHYAAADPEVREVLEATASGDATEPTALADVPEPVAALFDRIDVGYYRGDAAEITSLELDKVAGVESAMDVLGVTDPFLLVMGDSKSDLRVMEWAAANDYGVAAAPEHASTAVLSHVLDRDELVFDRGGSARMLRTAYALNLLARLE